jgi:hypothetical protein
MIRRRRGESSTPVDDGIGFGAKGTRYFLLNGLEEDFLQKKLM